MRLLAPVDQQAHGNAVVTASQRILIRFHPVFRHWNAGLFSAFSVLAPQAAPRLQSEPATLVWVYSCVRSKPVLKTGMPLRIPRVRILSLRFGGTLQNAVFFEKPRGCLGGSLRFWALCLACVRRPVPRGSRSANRGKLWQYEEN